MPSIEERSTKEGTTTYRVRVRRKGYPTQTASFDRLTDAHQWAYITEAAIAEGRQIIPPKLVEHTVTELIDRYIAEVLPYKSASSKYMIDAAMSYEMAIQEFGNSKQSVHPRNRAVKQLNKLFKKMSTKSRKRFEHRKKSINSWSENL